jgi:uncharacterized protein YbjT (DUF2867 family)
MRILLLGATGRTGKHVLSYALEKGYDVSCLVRKPERLTQHPSLSIFEGNPTNPKDLQKAMEGCQAIISVLNISRTSDFPWAKLRTPKTFLSDSMSNIINQVTNHNIKRIVLCSAWGVGETKKDIPFWFRWTIDCSNIKYAYLNHERQENLLRKTGLGYTIVRPVGLTNFNKKLGVRESESNQPKPNLLISRKAAARFMVDSLEREEIQGKTIAISNT